MDASLTFELSDVEVETLRRAAARLGVAVDPKRRSYTGAELSQFGLVREGYSRAELANHSVSPRTLTSQDGGLPSLPIDAPFGEGIRKSQLPVDMMPMRVAKTYFAPGTTVTMHVHPPDNADDPGGGLRMVAVGSVEFEGKTLLPGDWFFVPNGVPYAFKTDSQCETVLFYTYRFFGAVEGNRFSHPHT